MIVSKGSIRDHNTLVDKVLTRLDDEGFALKLSKCDFSMNQLSWLGYDIDSEGYRPKRSKIDAVLALEPPKSLKQLRSFMGILFTTIFAESAGPFGPVTPLLKSK